MFRISEPDSKFEARCQPALVKNDREKVLCHRWNWCNKQWEAFGIDYFLPLGTDEGGCDAETCAAIGVMMLAERQLQVGVIIYLCFRIFNLLRLVTWELSDQTRQPLC